MHKNTRKLHGKTIKTIRKGSINCWVITFTDGDKIELWAENDGPLGLGQIWLNNYNPENHKRRSKNDEDDPMRENSVPARWEDTRL